MPAFYCCYLLRSKTRKSFYIGSTPNPARRLAQHNGRSKGGAKRTSYDGKRPWEMTCIVTGFPSKIAALQFEWAWQNTHATRHIDRHLRDARAANSQGAAKAAAGSSSPRKRRARPPMSLQARLKNLYHLLGVRSFERWPLQIRFFSTDVFEVWRKCTAGLTAGISDDLAVRLTPTQIPAPVNGTSAGDVVYEVPEVIREIPVAYEDCKTQLEASTELLGDGTTHHCAICQQTSRTSTSLLVLCLNQDCQGVFHMSCLAARFLKEEGNKDALIPSKGSCPKCHTSMQWSTIVKELSVRARGQTELELLFKKRRRKKANDAETAAVEDEDEALDETWVDEVQDEEEDKEFPMIDKIIARPP